MNILRSFIFFALIGSLWAGELEDAKAAYAKKEREMKEVLADLKKSLRARMLVLVEDSQENWPHYREGISDFQARDKDPEGSIEKWQMATHLTESRIQWLKAWKVADERKGWAGDYMDEHGGSLQIMEKDGQTLFALSVVRGPTFHSGGIGGALKVDGEKARYETRAFADAELTTLTFSRAEDGSDRLKVDGKHTGPFHGARAYFDGLYIWKGELSEEQKKQMQMQLEEGF